MISAAVLFLITCAAFTVVMCLLGIGRLAQGRDLHTGCHAAHGHCTSCKGSGGPPPSSSGQPAAP